MGRIKKIQKRIEENITWKTRESAQNHWRVLNARALAGKLIALILA